MGNVNSQGLTWLEWRNAAGYADANFSGHDGGMHPDTYSCQLHGQTSEIVIYRPDPELVAAVKAGNVEYNRRHGK